MGRLEGRIAVVTGAARGIGAAIATRFTAEGARVVLADIQSELAAETARSAGGAATAVSTDVTDPGEVRDLFSRVEQEHGRLDALVINAGRPMQLGTLGTSEEHWEECVNLNLRSAWYCAREAHRLLQRSRAGSIVTIASAQGLRSGRRGFPYSAAKGGLLAMTRSMAVEYAPHGIRVNAIIPGQIESVRTEPYFESFTDPAEARRRVISSFPLGRLGRPEEIAGAALFLASDDASYVTGTWLYVDGGRDAAMVDLSDLERPQREEPA